MRMTSHHLREAYLIDAFPLYSDGYERILLSLCDKVKCKKLTHPEDIDLVKFKNAKSGLVIMDIWSFGARGLDILIDLRIRYPNLPIILCIDLEQDSNLNKYVSLGVLAVLSKRTSVTNLRSQLFHLTNYAAMATSENGAMDHSEPLKTQIDQEIIITKKELMTLRYLLRGLINKDIAKLMGVCESTTKSHVSSLIRKLGVINRTQIIKEFQHQRGEDRIVKHYKKQKVVAISEARKLLAKGLVQVEDIQVVI